MFDTNELAMMWFALVMEQKEYDEGSKNWWRRERLIRKVEKQLGMTERPTVREVKDMPVGTCSCNGCGNRPGPWHDEDCPAWMASEDFNAR